MKKAFYVITHNSKEIVMPSYVNPLKSDILMCEVPEEKQDEFAEWLKTNKESIMFTIDNRK